MGMFDWYNPKSLPACPFCGESLERWQGKDGSNACLVWTEGCAAPVAEWTSDSYADQRLPERFEIYTDCFCGAQPEAVGRTVNGIWSSTELISDKNAVPYPNENERDFKRRLKYLAAKILAPEKFKKAAKPKEDEL